MNTRLALATGAALVAVPLTATSAQAICIASTPAELRARAHVIFDSVALDGPTVTGVQRFRVTRYRKGTGPAVVRVRTGVVRSADGSFVTTSISLFVKKGERWRIFARGSARKVLPSNYCDGSRRLK